MTHERMLKEFGVPRRYVHLDPMKLKLDSFCENLGTYCRSPVVTKWDRKEWIAVSAGPGRGKTAWLTSVFNQSVEDKLNERDDIWISDNGPRKPIWINELQMHMTMNRLGESSAGSRSAYLQSLAKTPLLMLDDIGAGTTSEFKRTALQYIINERYNDDRRTLITTNLTPDEFFNLIGKASSSRMMEMCGNFWRIKGPDRRLERRSHG